MIPVPVAFLTVEAPAGWRRELRGPRLFLVPPAPGGHVVIAPPVRRTVWLDPRELLERTLLAELATFAALHRTDVAPLVTRGGLSGVCADVVALDAAGNPREWRSYAVLGDGPRLHTLVLQATPDAFPALREVFYPMAQSA